MTASQYICERKDNGKKIPTDSCFQTIMEKKVEHDNLASRKKYLLEFVYSEYISEINRKYLIENKVLGYYTILGISFTAFIVSFLNIFTKNFYFEHTLNGYMNAICLVISISYLFFISIILIFLNRSFRPKDTLHHDVKNYWNELQFASDNLVYDSLYKNIIDCLDFNREENQKTVDYLKMVNYFMSWSIFFNILFIIKIIISILSNIGGN